MGKEQEAAKEETKVEPKPEDKKEATPTPPEKPEGVTKEEYERLQAELQTADGRWKTAQGTINKLQEKIQGLEDNQELWKVLIGMNAERQGISEAESAEDLKKRRPDLLQQYQIVEQRQQSRRAQEKVNSYRSTVEGELGLNPADEDYQIIQAYVNTGNFNAADKKIAAVKAKRTEQPEGKESKSDTEDQKVERRVKEELEKRGLLTPEGGEPSAAGKPTFTRDQIADRKFYFEHKDEILEAQKEGRIK